VLDAAGLQSRFSSRSRCRLTRAVAAAIALQHKRTAAWLRASRKGPSAEKGRSARVADRRKTAGGGFPGERAWSDGMVIEDRHQSRSDGLLNLTRAAACHLHGVRFNSDAARRATRACSSGGGSVRDIQHLGYEACYSVIITGCEPPRHSGIHQYLQQRIARRQLRPQPGLAGALLCTHNPRIIAQAAGRQNC